MAIGKAGVHIRFALAMNCVYILKSEKNGRYYIGSTNNLDRRLAEHKFGKTKSLKHLRPLTLVFMKEYENLGVARVVERKLKKLKNRNIIEQVIEDKDIRMGL